MGRVNLQELKRAITAETKLVSVIFANHEVGTLNPIGEVSAMCHAKNTLLHSDSVQAVGKIPIDVQQLQLDMMSFSAHKLYGPQGVGALFLRRGEPRIVLSPILHGGGQEQRLRSGTLPVALIVGFGKACELAEKNMYEQNRQIRRLRDTLWEKMKQEIPTAIRNGCPRNNLPGNLNVSFPDIDGDALISHLKTIALSSGSTCTSDQGQGSRVLQAMGVSETLSFSSLRMGLGHNNTEEDIPYIIGEIRSVYEFLKMSHDCS